MTDSTGGAPAPAVAAPAPGGSWSGRARAAGLRIGGLVIAILIVVIIFTLLSKPNTFLSITNALGIMRSMSTIAIVALGLTLVIVVGEIDLSFGYMYGLASILIGVAWVVWGWPIWFAIPLAFVAAIGLGSINAFLVTVLKIPSFIVTLGPANSSSARPCSCPTRRPSTRPTRRRARPCPRSRSTGSSACPTRTCRSASRCRRSGCSGWPSSSASS